LFDYDNPEWYRRFLVHLRYDLDERDYPRMAKLVARFLNRELDIPPIAPREDDATFESDIQQLRSQGFCRLGSRLTEKQISDTRRSIKDRPLTDQWDVVPGQFQLEAIPNTVNAAIYDRATATTACHLAELANHPDILARVSAYLGAPPTIQHYELWWSFANREQARGPQLFHVDRACYKFVKLFIYLTDVDEDAGPHVYIPGSASRAFVDERVQAMEQMKPGLGEIAKRMLADVRTSDRDMETLFGAGHIETITGRAGDAFLVDTSGYHKGLLPDKHNRLVFQALFTLLPTIRDAVAPNVIPGFVNRLSEWSTNAVSHETLRYINRLVVRDPPREEPTSKV
jgi:hypothetical protein